jgi:hypothetical protein
MQRQGKLEHAVCLVGECPKHCMPVVGPVYSVLARHTIREGRFYTDRHSVPECVSKITHPLMPPAVRSSVQYSSNVRV